MHSQLLVDVPVTHYHQRRMMSVATVQAHGASSSLYLNEVILEGVIGDSSPENLLGIEIIGIWFHIKHLCHLGEPKCNYTRRFVDRVNTAKQSKPRFSNLPYAGQKNCVWKKSGRLNFNDIK